MKRRLCMFLICGLLMPAASFALVNVLGSIAEKESRSSAVQFSCAGNYVKEVSINGDRFKIQVPPGTCKIRVVVEKGVFSTVETVYFEDRESVRLYLKLQRRGNNWVLTAHVE